MKNNRPIFWHEGLFLRPHHFQQQDLYYQNLVQEQTRLANPYNWGVSALTINPSRLNNQVFELDHGEFVFKDGARVIVPENANLAPRSFEDHWDPNGDTLPVYLGLRQLLNHESNVKETDNGDDSALGENKLLLELRYQVGATGRIVSDLYRRDSKEDIRFLSYNLQVFFGKEVDDAVDFDTFKIAELRKFGTEVKLVDKFVPPVIKINGATQLVKIVRDLKEQLTTRVKELSLYRDDRTADINQFSGRDTFFLMALRTLSRQVPLLHHLTEQGLASPWQVYGLLRQLVGELSAFSSRFDLFGLEQEESIETTQYRHDDLGECFARISSTISAMLEELTAGPDFTAAMDFDGTYYYADLDDRVFQHGSQVFLCLRSQLPAEYLVATVGAMIKIASRELLPLLIARSLAGVNAKYLESPPTALARRAGTYYFQLDTNGEAWSALKEGRNIAAYLDNPPADLELELMVIYG